VSGEARFAFRLELVLTTDTRHLTPVTRRIYE
jgi:hypothetical protein